MRFSAILMLISGTLLGSCSDNKEAADGPKSYYDISGFFKSEAQRLQRLNPEVEKTVTQDSSVERKQVKISKWENEFGLFSSSDINKPSWKDSYEIRASAGIVEYVARDEALRTLKIRIEKNKAGSISRITISNKVKNALYSSVETLEYIPDSLYRVDKTNEVKIIGKNHYIISGKF